MKDEPLIANPWFPQPKIPWDENDPKRQGLWGRFVTDLLWPAGMFGLAFVFAHAFPASLANLLRTASSENKWEFVVAWLLLALAIPVTLLAGVLVVLMGHWVVMAALPFKRRVIDRGIAYWFGPLPRPQKVEKAHGFLTYVFFLLAAGVAPTALNPLFREELTAGNVFIGGSATVLTLFLASLVYLEERARQRARKLSDTLDSLPAIAEWKCPGNLTQRAFVAHWTDLHIAAKGKAIGVAGERLKELVARHATVLAEASLLLVTGDVTDTGSADEWKCFVDIVPEFLRRKIVIVPGNHDLNTISLFSLWRRDCDLVERRIRQIRWLCAVDVLQGDRTTILDKSGQFVPIRSYLAQVRGELVKFTASPPVRRYCVRYQSTRSPQSVEEVTTKDEKRLLQLPSRVWNDVFPMVVTAPDCDLHVVVVDSNDISTNVITNAFGRFTVTQLRRLRRVVRALAGKHPILFASHHHLGVPEWLGITREDWMSRALSSVNAAAFFRAAGRQRSSVLFNGHRHIRYLGRLAFQHGTMDVISGPSTTHGDASRPKKEQKPGFGLYPLSWDDSLNVSLSGKRWMP